jgi:histone arginine demethylase JMJD6
MKFEIERRANLSYEEFSDRYLYPHKPVIITEALSRWQALGRWTPEFFQQEFGDMKFGGNDDLRKYVGSEKENEGAVDYTLGQFINHVLKSTDEHPAPYFRNRILYDLFPSLKQDVQPLPDYFFPNWLPDRYISKSVGEVLNRGAALEVYIGGRGGAFPVLHYDGAGTHAFVMQIYGRKQFIIYPPEQESFLYPSPEKQNLSLVNNIDSPDLERFPLFARAAATTFVLEPGELVFVPSHWWHTTKMLTASISVSINVVNQSNWHALVAYVAMRRGNPLIAFASRVYLTGAGAWRSRRDRDWFKRVQRAA